MDKDFDGCYYTETGIALDESQNPDFYYSRPYYWKHIPTGNTGSRVGYFSSERAFWCSLDRWNRVSPSIWNYSFTSN